MLNVPNVLTLGRLVAIPIFLRSQIARAIHAVRRSPDHEAADRDAAAGAPGVGDDARADG